MDQRVLPPGRDIAQRDAAQTGGSLDRPYIVPDMASFSSAPQTNVSLADYWRILRKRKSVIVVTAVVIFTLVTIYTLHTTPIYEAVGRISIGRPNSEFLLMKGEAPVQDDDYTVSMETQVRILQSDSLALAVIKKLGLDRSGASSAAKPGAASAIDSSRNDNAQTSALINSFKGGMRIITVPNTRVMEIHYSSPDPKLAATIVNALIDTYIERNIRTKFESTTQAADWLSKQLADLQVKVEVSQEKLVNYQKEKGIIGGDEKTNLITAKLSELNTELSAAEAERIHKQAMYQYASSGNADKMGTDEKATLFNKLREEEISLKNQIAQASVQFGPSYPKLLELKNRLEQAQKDLQAETQKNVVRMQNDYLAALQREKMLRAAFEAQKQEANQLNQSAIEYNLLKRDADANRQLYEGLLQKLKEAGISAGLTSTNVQIVDSARTPTFPSKPNVPLNLELGLLFGIIAGVVLALTNEALDNTIMTPEHVEFYSGLPALGMIPLKSTMRVAGANGSSEKNKLLPSRSDAERNPSVELVTYARPNSELAEAYRALRTSILLGSAAAPPKVILFTSPLPQEGKTTTAVNSAVSLAQQGRNVLLVDADLRRPAVHVAFGLKPRAGLSDVLAGRNKLEEALVASPQVPNLTILPAGAVPPHPAELLSSEGMKQLLARWSKEFDHVIIDSPPMLTVTDAVLLSVSVDRVILVVRAGGTSKNALRRSCELLARVNANVLGVVLNAVDLKSPDHYHYYYSGTKYYDGYYHE
jgi:capsular exopolysaccharide synthesis family protein